MTRLFVALAVFALLAGTLLALPTAPAPRPSHLPIPSLIQALGHADFTERETASRELDRIGTAALPDLRRELTRTTDGEIRRRAQILIARLQKRQADEEALAPTRVEIDAVNETLEHIAANLSQQTGYEIVISAPNTIVTLKTGRVSFWDAIAQLSDIADLQIASVGGIKAPRPAKTSEGPTTIQKNGVSDLEVETLPQPAADRDTDPAAKLEQLKKDLEKIAKAREDVAKEANATAPARAAALERIRADAERKIKEVQRDLALRKQGIAPPPVPAAKPMAIAPSPQVTAPQATPRNVANSIVLEPRQGAKRPAANFGAVRLEAMNMPESAAVADAVAVLVQAWVEPRLQWQKTHGVRVRQATDAQGQALMAEPGSTVASGPTVIDGNGIQMVQNINGGVLVINNANGGRVVINGQINGRVVVNNGNVTIDGNASAGDPRAVGSFVPNNRQAVVKLHPGEKATVALRELSGVFEALVRAAPQALATIDDVATAGEASNAGVRLKTSGFTKTSDGRGMIDVELEFNPSQVQPAEPVASSATGGKPNTTGPLVIRGGAANTSGTNRAFYGLQLTDEAGKPLALQARQTSTTHHGNGSQITMKFSFTIASGDLDRVPKALSFWGTHSASVDIPFHLQNVPTLAAKK